VTLVARPRSLVRIGMLGGQCPTAERTVGHGVLAARAKGNDGLPGDVATG